MHTPHLRRFFGVAELATARKFQIGNLKFQIEEQGSRERRRERKTLGVAWDPGLPSWARFVSRLRR